MSDSKKPKRKAGRPPNPPIARIRAICWYYSVLEATGEPSGYALDNLFRLNRPRRIRSDQKAKSACKFDKYRRGEHLPESALVDLVGERYPETKALFHHPFWILAEPEITSIEKLEQLIALLPPEVRCSAPKSLLDELFHSRENGLKLEEVAEIGTVDALASCLGQIHRQRLTGDGFGEILSAAPTVDAFVRCFALEPFAYVENEFKDYLFDNFITGFMSEQLRSKKTQRLMRSNGNTVRICRDIVGSLRYFEDHEIPLNALYLVERVVPKEVLRKYARRSLRTRDAYFRQLPVAIDLLDQLKTWQRNGRRYIWSTS